MTEERANFHKALETALNRHGYSFQYAVIAQANKLFNHKLSPWRAPVPEFPVEVRGHGTRVDAILQHRSRPLFLIVETKRVNPALSNWCFFKAPYPGDILSKEISTEEIHYQGPGQYHTNLERIHSSDEVYHLGIEVKSDKPGDPHGKGRGGIERAATQVLRGLNGFIEFLSDNLQLVKRHGSIAFLPVIITTAQLFVTNVDISRADLDTGDLQLFEQGLNESDWLFYNYHQSPGLKHSVFLRGKKNELRQILHDQFVRSIAIVNPNGLRDFLGNSIWS